MTPCNEGHEICDLGVITEDNLDISEAFSAGVEIFPSQSELRKSVL